MISTFKATLASAVVAGACFFGGLQSTAQAQYLTGDLQLRTRNYTYSPYGAFNYVPYSNYRYGNNYRYYDNDRGYNQNVPYRGYYGQQEYYGAQQGYYYQPQQYYRYGNPYRGYVYTPFGDRY